MPCYTKFLIHENWIFSNCLRDLQQERIKNLPLFASTHHNGSVPWVIGLKQYKRLEKSSKLPTSWSCAALLKLMFHWIWSPKITIKSATEASFSHANWKTDGNESFRALLYSTWLTDNKQDYGRAPCTYIEIANHYWKHIPLVEDFTSNITNLHSPSSNDNIRFSLRKVDMTSFLFSS